MLANNWLEDDLQTWFTNMTCQWLADDLQTWFANTMTCQWLADNLPITYQCLANELQMICMYDLQMTCKQLAHDLQIWLTNELQIWLANVSCKCELKMNSK